MNIQNIQDKFYSHFQQHSSIIVKSPGRINIIGEHTDYNDGFVLPAAINKAVYVAVAPRQDNEICLYATDFREMFQVSAADLQPAEKGWPNYILGVVDQLQKRGLHVGGFNLFIDGDVPAGAGLSSSAAVECATAFALNELFSLELSRIDIARIGQLAEHTYVGVKCGIMDQFASVLSEKDQVFRLDCRSLAYEYFPLELGDYMILLLNTNVKHSLGDSQYNKRREKCELGVSWISERYPEVKSLRDVTVEMLDEVVKNRDEDVYVKCRYVVEENLRVVAACQAMEKGDLVSLGQHIYASHEGLSKAYQVSCEELDFLVNASYAYPDVLGARMMGGGFGGCTINLVKKDFLAQFVKEISASYQQQFGVSLTPYVVETADGTTRIA
ncbi:Galactokinase [Sphingobacterium spiritivorum]|uniref:Galactokinase n=1 Tax=Sphingobacterium spiritivorum TaxID=258 RepID=A0A380C3H2_SPHSI|nr:galactokinase [Sphingobacterium spiritivorum]SUJ12096.1 Galactokinase [Sphingobacterium spiritivorum]